MEVFATFISLNPTSSDKSLFRASDKEGSGGLNPTSSDKRPFYSFICSGSSCLNPTSSDKSKDE